MLRHLIANHKNTDPKAFENDGNFNSFVCHPSISLYGIFSSNRGAGCIASLLNSHLCAGSTDIPVTTFSKWLVALQLLKAFLQKAGLG